MSKLLPSSRDVLAALREALGPAALADRSIRRFLAGDRGARVGEERFYRDVSLALITRIDAGGPGEKAFKDLKPRVDRLIGHVLKLRVEKWDRIHFRDTEDVPEIGPGLRAIWASIYASDVGLSFGAFRFLVGLPELGPGQLAWTDPSPRGRSALLRSVLDERGWSRSQLANLCSSRANRTVPDNTVDSWLDEARRPGPEYLRVLAGVLGDDDLERRRWARRLAGHYVMSDLMQRLASHLGEQTAREVGQEFVSTLRATHAFLAGCDAPRDAASSLLVRGVFSPHASEIEEDVEPRLRAI